MFALIFENKVVDIVSKEFPCVESMKWVECNNDVKVGWFYINGSFKETDKTNEELFQNAKDAKLAELNAYYESRECWLFKIKSTQLSASITRDADWFALKLPAINGLFIMQTDAGVPVQVNLTKEQALTINNKINIEMSLAINLQKYQCLSAINAAKTLEEIEAVDVKTALGEIPRVIDIDTIV